MKFGSQSLFKYSRESLSLLFFSSFNIFITRSYFLLISWAWPDPLWTEAWRFLPSGRWFGLKVSESSEMRIECWKISLLLLVTLISAARLEPLERWQGFQEKPMSKRNMEPTLKFFIESYNNASNDTYLFQVDKLLRSQMQVCFCFSSWGLLINSDTGGYSVTTRSNQHKVFLSGDELTWKTHAL